MTQAASSRSDRPVTVRKTSSSVGRDRLTDTSVAPVSSSSRTSSTRARSPWSTVRRSVAPLPVTSRTPGWPAIASRARSTSPRISSVTTSPEIRRFSSSGVPSATMRPWSMISSRSASASASSR